MERRFQYDVLFTNHTQYRARARARAREHNNTTENFILNFTHLFHVPEHYIVMYVCIFILRICARRRRSLNEAFLVKIANI